MCRTASRSTWLSYQKRSTSPLTVGFLSLFYTTLTRSCRTDLFFQLHAKHSCGLFLFLSLRVVEQSRWVVLWCRVVPEDHQLADVLVVILSWPDCWGNPLWCMLLVLKFCIMTPFLTFYCFSFGKGGGGKRCLLFVPSHLFVFKGIKTFYTVTVYCVVAVWLPLTPV